MDGGQKIDINLESPLDTKSSDMLVSVNDIKFAHNRQKFQGHVLPTSLRYERNGWAAGWYVYDFTIGGGYIFSRSRYTSLGGVAYGGVAQYLAATRTKINNAPTYAITLRVAEDNNPDNVDAIQNRPFAVLYYTQAQTIEARECKEATIDFGDVNPLCPKIHIDYAVNGVSYPQDFVFEFDVCSDDTPEFSIDGTDNKLRLSYIDRAADGTVSALLSNDNINWTESFEINVPKNITDNLDNTFAEFKALKVYDDFANEGLVSFAYWAVPVSSDRTDTLVYLTSETGDLSIHSYYYAIDTDLNDIVAAVQSFRDNRLANQPSMLSTTFGGLFGSQSVDQYAGLSIAAIHYSQPLVNGEPDWQSDPLVINFEAEILSKIPLHKYDVAFKDISFSIQGTKKLFNNEADTAFNTYTVTYDKATNNIVDDIVHGTFISNPLNNYSLDKIVVYGLAGPDVSVPSLLEIEISSLDSSVSSNWSDAIVAAPGEVNAYSTYYTSHIGMETTVPILTVKTKSFKLPGEVSNRDVTIQLYLKYPGHYIDAIRQDDVGCALAVLVYDNLSMWHKDYLMYYRESNGTPLYNELKGVASVIDGVNYTAKSGSAKDIILNASQEIDYGDAYIAGRYILGRVVDVKLSLAGVNGVKYSGDNSVDMHLIGINTNLLILQNTVDVTWRNSGNGVSRTGLSSSYGISTGNAPYSTSWSNTIVRRRQAHRTTDRVLITDMICEDDNSVVSNYNGYFCLSRNSLNSGAYMSYFIDDIDKYDVNITGATVSVDCYGTLKAMTASQYPSEATINYGKWYHFTPEGITMKCAWDDDHPMEILGRYSSVPLFDKYGDEIYLDCYRIRVYTDGVFNSNNTTEYIIPVESLLIKDITIVVGNDNGVDDVDTAGNEHWNCVITFGDMNSCLTDGEFTYGTDHIYYSAVDAGTNGYLAYINNFNKVPTGVGDKFKDYGGALLINNAIYKLSVSSVIETQVTQGSDVYTGLDLRIDKLLDLSSGTSATGIPGLAITGLTPNAITKFAINNISTDFDALILFTSSYDYICNFDWHNECTTFAGTTLSLLNSEYICMDIMDNTTGELIIDHKRDKIDLSSFELKVYLDKEHVCKGQLYCDFTTGKSSSDTLTSQQMQNNSYLARIHRASNVSRAFFPACKYTDDNASHSAYAPEYGVCQGIAVFDTFHISDLPDGYHICMLSPLGKYILPPYVSNDTLKIYARKTYAHHIDITPESFIYNTEYTINYLDSSINDISRVQITARNPSNIFTAGNNDLDDNNKYYTGKSILKPVAISYYNNQLQITYNAIGGETVNIGGNALDLGGSDISIKQVSNLNSIYLPEYVDGTTKYQLYISDDFKLKLKEANELRDTISDIDKHYLIIDMTGILLNQFTGKYTISLDIVVTHNNISNAAIAVDYSSLADLPYTDSTTTPYHFKEESNDLQLLFRDTLSGSASVGLPKLPTFSNSIVNNKVLLKSATIDNTSAKYDYAKNVLTDMKVYDSNVAYTDVSLVDLVVNKYYNAYTININQSVNTIIYFKHFGVYKIDFTNVEGKIDRIEYDRTSGAFMLVGCNVQVLSGATYTNTEYSYGFYFTDFDDPTICTPKYLLFTATDVRGYATRDIAEESAAGQIGIQQIPFAKVMCENEYQLIKQMWDSTDAVEKFWWIDETHILQLTKTTLRIREKSEANDAVSGKTLYDDWMGNIWTSSNDNHYNFNRTEYINSESDTYMCSSATGENARAYLYILHAVDYNTIEVNIYDPLLIDNTPDGHAMHKVHSIKITFKHVELGNALNLNNDITDNHITVGTYSDILASAILSDSKLSVVEINGKHWLGIQYDKNFNQWSFCLGPDNFAVVHGYGCIGINGYATGGMLPTECFGDVGNGTIGFIGFDSEGKVDNIDILEAEDENITDISKFNLFNKRIVGDENQQWYITDELKSIVMAVDLNNSSYNKKLLPITNKYDQIYSSPSYAKYTVHALGAQVKQLVDMFATKDITLWDTIIRYALFPVIWFLSPYTNVINYLQQTLGQYAYVHYNTTSIGKRSNKVQDNTVNNAGLTEDESKTHIDALLSDDLSFDVQHIAQEQSFKDNTWDNVLGIFTSMVVSATDYSMQSLAVNSAQNQSAVNDVGRKFSQAFLQNIGSMSVTGFSMHSTKPMLKSEVTAVKTLDMFYSTSAKQRCFAGPGYTQMQFVAQCTAQSVTSVQLDAQQTQVFLLLKELTTWQAKAELFLIEQMKDFLFKESDNLSSGTSAGVVVGLGWIPALVMSAAGYALVAAKALVKLGTDTVDSMLSSFFPNGIQTTVTAQLSRHNYDIEGKHSYGNKSETFMWPCVDCNSKLYTDETVEAILQEKPWPLEMPKTTFGNLKVESIYAGQPACTTIRPARLDDSTYNGEVEYNIASCKGTQRRVALPEGTAYVIGAESFLPTTAFKNENIGEGEPVFTPPAIQDYIIDKKWNIFATSMAGEVLWISCKDTKLFDGEYTNIIAGDNFCGIAAPHVAIEVKHEIQEEFIRPWAITPDVIALNITGLNCVYDKIAYHAFDGYGYRITDWLGAAGMNKEHYTLQYCFQINDRFKRSNKLPPNQFLGNFQAVPNMAIDVHDDLYNDIQVTAEDIGMKVGVTGENKDQQRYALPIFTEQISVLPAVVRALSPYKLAVIEGITSLTTEARTSNGNYKMPDSVDFSINDRLYRITNEYICSVEHERGLEVVKYLVPTLGLVFLGASPYMAYFYNQATRQYYTFQGGNSLQIAEMLERFRNIKNGYWDFINQELVMSCLATFNRLDDSVKDDLDETDNVIVPVFKHAKVQGEVTPPNTTIFNTRSWFKVIPTAAGLVFQGPNRCIINRYVYSDYMLSDIKLNKRKWIRIPREDYHPVRKYPDNYNDIMTNVNSKCVTGWTHNPFLLVTAPLGINEETDCRFEWEITFAWTAEMEQIYENDEYATVNIMAETMSPGGKVTSRPTHIFLTKELFTRSNNFGYYSFRYQSNNGIGNRERLHIWSDAYIAVSSIQIEYKPITEKRSEVLITQEDVKGMREM